MKRTNILTCAYFVPAQTPKYNLIHACKPGIVDRFEEIFIRKQKRRSLAFSYAVDDGSGQSLVALRDAFVNANRIFVLTDLDAFGLYSYVMIADFADSLGRTVKLLGITSSWLDAVEGLMVGNKKWVDVSCMPLMTSDVDPLFKIIRKRKLDKLLGQSCIDCLLAKRVFHLNAFLHKEPADRLQKFVDESLVS